MNATRFLNRKAVKVFLLEHAAATRHHRFERVSSATLVDVNEQVRRHLVQIVRCLPSKGKTI